MKLPRETIGRPFIVAAGMIALGAILVACPHQGPTPANPTPDASDAAPAPTCSVACARAVAVCPAVDRKTCLDICGREPAAYAATVSAAGSCADLKPQGPVNPSAHPAGH